MEYALSRYPCCGHHLAGILKSLRSVHVLPERCRHKVRLVERLDRQEWLYVRIDEIGHHEAGREQSLVVAQLARDDGWREVVAVGMQIAEHARKAVQDFI